MNRGHGLKSPSSGARSGRSATLAVIRSMPDSSSDARRVARRPPTLVQRSEFATHFRWCGCWRIGHADAVPYDPSIYQGCAAHYRSGRPPYSEKLEGFLAEELGHDATARLLDVGCGPGILTARLA